MADLNDRIVPLDQLDDFEVAEGDPDVRGWDVFASDGQRIGEVDQLLVDTEAMKVRYLDVDVDGNLIANAENTDRHILIPIGYARLDEGDDRVIVDQLASTEVATLPEYSHEPITRDFETSLRQRFDRPTTATTTGMSATTPRTEPLTGVGTGMGVGATTDGFATGSTRDTDIVPDRTTGAIGAAPELDRDKDSFYAHDLYDENRFYGSRRRGADEKRVQLNEERLEVGKREVQAGAVGIEKHVETRHVEREVPTTHEEVVVERRPVTEGMSTAPRITEDEIRVPLTQEEVVVEKRVVPKEELVVRKHEVTDTERVGADLRTETAEVHREGDVNIHEEPRRRDDLA